MTAMNVTFVGNGPEDNRKELVWGPGLTLPRDKPVLVDPDTAANEQRALAEHLLRKGKGLPFLKIEEVGGKKAKPAEHGQPAEGDYSEENGNGDTTIPDDWRDMHHTRMIALARRLGGGDEIATRDAAAAYIEACLKEQERAHG